MKLHPNRLLSTSVVLGCILMGYISYEVNAMGLGDWSYTTSHGTILHNSYGPTYIEYDGSKQLKNVGKWYFYKSHILGVTNMLSWQTDTTMYFILNEKTEEFFITSELEKWVREKEVRSLNPYFTRWYSSHDSQLFYLAIFVLSYPFVSIPVVLGILFLLFILTRQAYKHNFSFKHYSIHILLFSLLIIFLIYLSSTSVNSI